MNRLGLLLRNLWYFRGANLAVLAGMVVASAVLTGALMVGDSVRGSLVRLTTDRLGPVDHALIANGFFPDDLATRIAQTPAFPGQFAECAAGVWLRGGVSDEDENRFSPGVQVAALSDWITIPEGSCIINGELADALGIRSPGATVLLKLPLIEDTPRDAALAKRGARDVTSGLRLTVTRIERDRDMATLFTLAGGQRAPRNIWLNLNELQNAIGQPGRANLLLVQTRGGAISPDAAKQLTAILRGVARLDDYGLKIGSSDDRRESVLDARSTYIIPAVDRAADAAARELKIAPRRVSVYLINNTVKLAPDGQQADVIHYAIAAGLSHLDGAALGDDEIAINEWTAEQLYAKVGDRIRLDYFQRQSNGELREVRSDRPGANLTFRVARILPMSGLGVDKSLVPTYKGLTDADEFKNWEPPEGLPINKSLVSSADDDYWTKHKAAPKVFLNLATAQKLWGNVYGTINSIRIPADQSAAFEKHLLQHLDPDELGQAFVPLKAQQLWAASGGTDFSMLFVAFSFFLIAAATLLVAMLFRLNVEQRARQLGVLSAIGFGPRDLRRMALGEGLLLAMLGSLIGAGAAIGYTAAMIHALRTWWVGAVGTTALRLYVYWPTLLIGFVSSIVVAILAVYWAIRRIGRTPPVMLLTGTWSRPLRVGQTRARVLAHGTQTTADDPDSSSSSACHGQVLLPVSVHSTGRRQIVIGLAGLGCGVLLLLGGVIGLLSAQAAFMSGGGILLVSSLIFIAGWLRSTRRSADRRRWSIAALGFGGAGRSPARSISAIALIAFASFILVTVSAMRQSPPTDTRQRPSGAGGYQLILTADLPLLGDLGTDKGRSLLGIDPTAANQTAWNKAQFVSMRSWAGQDVSCLNLTRPSSPTILAVPPVMRNPDDFAFARTIRSAQNPWDLLNGDGGDEIPVIADDETATYILHLGLGQTMPITDQLGRPRKLKLVATLSHSIFQSELLMGEDEFLRLFPAQGGFGTVLVRTSDDEAARQLAPILSSQLRDFSVYAETTASRLARYQQVANTYLSTFSTLGALGLLLGTAGLAAVLLRNLAERRGELALLAAIGFSRARRLAMMLVENAALLLLGLAVGVGCALVGVLPAVIGSARPLNWAQVAGMLTAVLLAGISVVTAAVWLGGRRIGAADLRSE